MRIYNLMGIYVSNKKVSKFTEKTPNRVQNAVIIKQELVGYCEEETGECAMLRMHGVWLLPVKKPVSVRSGFFSH